MIFTVVKLMTVDGKSLLIIKTDESTLQISVYDEHTGTTLLRPCEPNIENMQWALNLLGADGGE